MRIIVNHVTRMDAGYICVAGLNVSDGRHIRPVLNQRLTTDLLAANGGPFALASLVDLGTVTPRRNPPEVEDHLFNPSHVRVIRTVADEQFWQVLQSVAQKSIVDIFGSAIKPFGRGCVVDKGNGKASLGCLIPASSPRLYVNDYDKIRIDLTDGNFRVDLSVTDIRLCEADHKTPKLNLISQFNARMQRGVPVILSVGLTRAWRQPGDTMERHWLQVNNIHLQSL